MNFKTARHYQWGHLRLIDEIAEPVMETGPDGPYETGEYEMVWELECDCGYKWQLKKSEFPGRLALRSCRRPECEFSKPAKPTEPAKPLPAVRPVPLRPGRPMGENGPARNVAMYLPDVINNQIRDYAQKHNLSFSRACVWLLTLGLAQALVEEE